MKRNTIFSIVCGTFVVAIGARTTWGSQAGGLPSLSDAVAALQSAVGALQTSLGSVPERVEALEDEVQTLQAGSGAWTTVSDQTLAAPAASMTVSGLNLATDRAYMLILELAMDANPTRININGDAVVANYQGFTTQTSFNGTSMVVAGFKSHNVMFTATGGDLAAKVLFTPTPSGRVMMQGEIGNVDTTDATQGNDAQCTFNVLHKTVANMTSLTVVDAGGMFGAGSRLILLKLGT
jgi:hypothetical protein